MKRHYLLIPFILLTLSPACLGQGCAETKENPLIRSSDIFLKEKIRINTLNQVSYSYRLSDDSLSLRLAQQALNLSKKINYTTGEASANNIIGIFYYNHTEFVKALDYAISSLNLYKKHNGDTVLMHANRLSGAIFLSLKRLDRAEEYSKIGLVLAKETRNIENIINFSVGLGSVMYETGKIKKALDYFYYALSLSKKHPDINLQVWVLLNIGNLYLSQKQTETALLFYRKAINKSPKALQVENGTLYTLVAHIYEQKSDYKDALYYNRAALNVRRNNKFEMLVSSSLINIGHIYAKMEMLDSALVYLQSGLTKAAHVKAAFLLENGYKNLYEVYVLKKDWQNAFSALKEYIVSREKLAFEKKQNEITILEANRIINEKEKQTVELKNQNAIQALQMKNRNLQLLLVLSVLILMIIIIAYVVRLLIRNKKEKEVYREINDQLQDEIKEKEVENEELSKSEQHFRFLADNAADPIVLMDRDFKCLYVSPFCEFVFGYSPDELLALNDFREIIHMDSLKGFVLEFDTMLEFRDSSRFIYKVVRKDGETFWAESTINPIFDESTQTLKAMLSITRDITEKINQEEIMYEAASHQELLVKEVHHRVKNNLKILAHMMDMQKNRVSDPKTLNILSDLQFRVNAMTLVHEQLYKSRNIEVLPIGDYLSNLIHIVSSTFSDGRIKVHHDLYDELLEVETMLPLGLVVNELLTNAYKYAFPGNKEGNIWVTYKKSRRQKRSSFPMRKLTVKDDGVGLPDGFQFKNRNSMGSQVINLLSELLEAELKIDGNNGACFSLILPVSRER
jgi:PAS domain S-box-containing protein